MSVRDHGEALFKKFHCVQQVQPRSDPPILPNTGKTVQKGQLKAKQAFQWGSLLARMHRAMQDLSFPSIEERNFLWSWEGVLKIRQFIGVHKDEKRRALIDSTLEKYETIAYPQLAMEERGELMYKVVANVHNSSLSSRESSFPD